MKACEQEERYRIWLYDALHGSGARMGELIASYGSAQDVFARARADQLVYAGSAKNNPIKALHAAADEKRIDRLLASYHATGIHALTRISEAYPALLKEIYDPPEILFIRGKLKNTQALHLAVIGARKCTEYGRATALRFCKELAQSGVCVVSGLAYGIDAAAARGALQSESEYPTVAVLGCGVDVIYPQSSKKEYDEIVQRAAVISEFLPGTPPIAANFPRRNRIISGLAKGTLVVEAGEKSGTNITVDFALEQGRDVFAIPGRINDEESRGTNRYIRDGYAKAALCVEDILVEYGLHTGAQPPIKRDFSGLPQEQQRICQLLENGEKNFDELCILSGYPVPMLNSVLTVMEFSGIIRQMSGRMYKL